jgi:hypothetical protein
MDEHSMSDVPVDRLTRMCDAMTEAFDAHPEHEDGDKCIVFLDDQEHGGIVLHGYDDHFEALIALIIHLRAIFRANGQELQLVGIPDDISELFDGD